VGNVECDYVAPERGNIERINDEAGKDPVSPGNNPEHRAWRQRTGELALGVTCAGQFGMSFASGIEGRLGSAFMAGLTIMLGVSAIRDKLLKRPGGD
jgi:hypothetical protein